MRVPMHARRYVAQLADEWVCWTVERGPLIGKWLLTSACSAPWLPVFHSLLARLEISRSLVMLLH